MFAHIQFNPNLRGLGWLISCLRCAYDCDTPRYVTTKVVAFRWSMCFDCAMGRRSGRMHVDQAGRHYTTVGGERRSYPTYLLRRSYRDERGRPRKETLANLTGLPEESVAALRATLKGRTLVDAEAAFAVERSVPHGNVAAAHVMASRLGLQGLLGPACRERDIAYALIVSRAVRPESKLSTARWWPGSGRSRSSWPPGTWPRAGSPCSTCPARGWKARTVRLPASGTPATASAAAARSSTGC